MISQIMNFFFSKSYILIFGACALNQRFHAADHFVKSNILTFMILYFRSERGYVGVLVVLAVRLHAGTSY